jgi:AcrR family transcriptional regulator
VATRTKSSAERRRPLSRERVMRAAFDRTDEDGIGSLSMRKLAQELGVEAMSLYRHVRNKGEIVDGMIDLVFGEIGLPLSGVDWKTAMRQRAISAREVLARHPWAIGLMESRTSPGPATLRHHDAVIATLRAAGFSPELTAHAYALLDSYTYGFALQEVGLPFVGSDTVAGVAEPIMERFSTDEHPHLVEMATEYYLRPGYDFGDEFEWGLNLILDALTTSATSATRHPSDRDRESSAGQG